MKNSNTENYLAVCGDRHYVERVCQKMLIELGWSRKRRKKWLRRHGLKLTPQPDWLDCFPADDDSVLLGPCWCGEPNPQYEPVSGTCGGTGEVNCFCGGDLCVCHNHGAAACPGCEDCDGCHETGFEDDDDEDYL